LSRRRRRWALLAAAVLALSVPLGCSKGASKVEDEDAEPGSPGVPRLPKEWGEVPRLSTEPPPDFRHLNLAPGESAPDAVAFGFVDHTVVTVGDVLTLTVAVNHAIGVQVGFPTFKRMNQFEVLPGDTVETEPTSDQRIVSFRRYQLQVFVPGTYRVPAVPVTYHDVDGHTRRVRTEPVEIVAASVIPEGVEPTDVIPIKPPKSAPLKFPKWVVPAAAGAVLVVAAVVTFLILRLRRRAPDRRRPLEAHEMALVELEALRARGLLAQGAFDDHFVELSLIFRRYLFRRFGWEALRSTSEEIGHSLSEAPYLGEHTYEVADRFMGVTDRVKFAAHHPNPVESDGTWNDVTYFIDLTRTMAPTVEPEGEGEGTR